MDQRLHEGLALRSLSRHGPLEAGPDLGEVDLGGGRGLVVHGPEQVGATVAQLTGASGQGVEALAAHLVRQGPRLESQEVALDGVLRSS